MIEMSGIGDTCPRLQYLIILAFKELDLQWTWHAVPLTVVGFLQTFSGAISLADVARD